MPPSPYPLFTTRLRSVRYCWPLVAMPPLPYPLVTTRLRSVRYCRPLVAMPPSPYPLVTARLRSVRYRWALVTMPLTIRLGYHLSAWCTLSLGLSYHANAPLRLDVLPRYSVFHYFGFLIARFVFYME